MQVWKYNNVFDHVEQTLIEKYSKNKEYQNCVFVLGYNLLTDLNHIRQQYKGMKVIIYQLEQLYNNSPWATNRHISILVNADEVWDYDMDNIKWLRTYTRIKPLFKPMVYTNSLAKLPSIKNENMDVDFLFYGYMHERRSKMLFHLQNKLMGRAKVVNLYGVWGEELDSYISRSKIILNIHSGNTSRQEQVRIYYPVINGRCVISEKSDNNYFNGCIIEAEYNKLVDACLQVWNTGYWEKVALSCSDNYKKLINQ